jgi:hypothetical protein
MSRKQRRQRQRKNFPWPFLVFGGILLIVAAFFLANRTGAGSGGGGGNGTPQISADPQKIDYGYVTFGNNKTFKIKVTNTGDGVLRFKDKPYVEVLEGC